MKRSAVVTPSKEESSYIETSQFKLVLAELRGTSEGIRRIEDRLTQTDDRVTQFENKMELATAKINTRFTMIEEKIESNIGMIDNKLSVFIKGDRQTFGSANDTAQQRDDNMTKKEEAAAIAEELYSYHSSNHKSNLLLVDKMIGEKAEFFDPIVKICPPFNILMSHVMVNNIGVSVKSVRHTMKISDWGEREAMRAGSSLAVFLRKRKTGDAALDAWRRHYVQVKKLFDEAEGCEEFMLVFANNLLRDR